jgi:uncharacterized protein YggU (UPF0235/DUF167 family)
MASVTVRVVPRSGVTAVSVEEDGRIVVRVRAAPERGRATEEARHALASALDVAPARIALRTGARSRKKVFSVEGMTEADLMMRLRTTGTG